MSISENSLKRMAAEEAVGRIESGMVIGLGTGSTTDFALHLIAERMLAGQLRDLRGVPSSLQTERRANELGIPLTNFMEEPVLDITIDGADEIDPDLGLIKGGGAALLREKIVAQASRYLLIIADESKVSTQLGTKSALPVEILPFGYGAIVEQVQGLGADVALRIDPTGGPVETDQGNWIIDCDFGPIKEAEALGKDLKHIAGIIEHGLFIDLAKEVIIASVEGVRSMKAPS